MMSAGCTPPADHRGEVPDVVAGLVHGGLAPAVARAAVREAVARGARVKFVQALDPEHDDVSRAAAEERAFAAALRALRESPRVPVTFEAITGEAGEVFVDRSVVASVLVVGREPAESASPVAEYCERHARCDVLTVKAEGESV